MHLAYWLYIFVFMEFVNQLAYKNKLLDLPLFTSPLFLSNVLLFCAFFYFNYFVLLPSLFKKKKFFLTVVSWFGLSLLFVGVRFGLQEWLFPKYLGFCNYCYANYSKQWGIYLVNNFFQSLSFLIMGGTMIWFADHWIKSERQKISLQKEKIAAERSMLQAQVSPHFLFNSLNNIYSMVYHQSEHSLLAIQKLSGMMRYMTTESSRELVSLSREVEYIEDYIQLQHYRNNHTMVNFFVTGEAANKYIAPLLLIAFVENAFKHGIIAEPAAPINIQLQIGENSLQFSVSNTINHDAKDTVSGIGLNNIRNRLLLQYPGQHLLNIKTEGELFMVNLELYTLKNIAS